MDRSAMALTPLAFAHAGLAPGVLQKVALIGLTWLVVFILTRISTRFFDLVDRRLTTYGVPERRLAKLDFLFDLFVVLIAVFVSLFILGIDQAIWGAVAVTSVAGIIIGLAAQQLGQNLLAGIMILFERPFVVGDVVDLDGRVGRIVKVTLHSTSLVTADGLQVLVPNSRVLGAPITNYSANPERRISVTVDVLESVALERVEAALRSAVDRESHLRLPERTQVFVTESLDEGTRWELRYWVDRMHFADHCRPSAMSRILTALDEAGLETAMPARVIHVRGDPAEGPRGTPTG